MPNNSNKTDYAVLVQEEQIKTIYRNMPAGFLLNVFAALPLVLIPESELSRKTLYIWLSCFGLAALLRPVLAYFYYRSPPEKKMSAYWARFYALLMFPTGMCWAALLLFFSPVESPEYAYIANLYAVGTTMTSLLYFYCYPPASLSMSVPILAVFLWVHLSQFTAGNMLPPALAILYTYILYTNGKRLYQSFLTQQNLRLSLAMERDKAEQAITMKDRFFAAANHDLRQPMNTLTLFVSLLQTESAGNKHISNIVSKTKEAVEALNTLFTGLLDLSKLESGTQSVSMNHLWLRDIMAPIENEFRIECQAKSLGFFCDTHDAIVYSDAVLLGRVIRNILSNAVKFTREGEVSVTTKRINDQVEISIRDTGIGITPTDQARIFEEYVQISNCDEKAASKGLGLGLSIVKRITQLLGHEMHFTSTPGEGTTFTLWVAQGDKNQVSDSHQAVPANRESGLLGLHVIYIEDDNSEREATLKLLQSWGCKTTAYKSILEWEQRTSDTSEPLDVVLSDYQLGEDRTGIDAINIIRKRYSKALPAAIISGDVTLDHSLIRSESSTSYFHKPLDTESLYQFLLNIKHRISVSKLAISS